MTEARDNRAENIQVVERFLAAFDRRWPTQQELDDLVVPDVVFVERPNLINPTGASETPPRCAPESRGAVTGRGYRPPVDDGRFRVEAKRPCVPQSASSAFRQGAR